MVGVLGSGDAVATTVRSASLGEIVGAADRIVIATVASVTEGADEHGIPSTYVTLEVSEHLKGSAADRFTIKQIGGTASIRIAGMPTYRPGEEVVLFLHKDSSAGFTSPVGLSQGRYRIVRHGSKAEVRRPPGSAGQAASASSAPYDPQAAQAASESVPDAPQSRMSLDDFRSLVVEALAE